MRTFCFRIRHSKETVKCLPQSNIVKLRNQPSINCWVSSSYRWAFSVFCPSSSSSSSAPPSSSSSSSSSSYRTKKTCVIYSVNITCSITLSRWAQECTWARAGQSQEISVMCLVTYIERTMSHISHLHFKII